MADVTENIAKVVHRQSEPEHSRNAAGDQMGEMSNYEIHGITEPLSV